MTSRPALGIQPNPQNRIVGGSGPRRAAQIASTLNDARKPGLTVEVAGDGDKQRMGESQPVKAAPGAATSGSQPSSSDAPASRLPALESQASGGFQVPFPPRPGQHPPEGGFAAFGSSDDGMSSLAKREARLQVAEPPSEALLLPQASKSRFRTSVQK